MTRPDAAATGATSPTGEGAAILAALARMEARLDALEARLAPALEWVEQAPAMTAMAGDIFDMWAARTGDVDERLRALLHIADRLSEPATLQVLEQAVSLANSGPDLTAMVGDMFDAWAAKKGDVDERLRSLLELADRLTEPTTLQALQQTVAMAKSAPGMAAMVGDILDEWAKNTGNVDERLRGVLQLADRLSDPKILALMTTGLELLESAPGTLAMIGDMLDSWADRARSNGVDMAVLVDNGARWLEAMLRLLTSPAGERLMQAVIPDAQTVELLTKAMDALAKANEEPPTKMGAWGALRALGDPDIQSALGFTLRIAKHFGHAQSTDHAKQLPA